jgi:hypothetical protein
VYPEALHVFTEQVRHEDVGGRESKAPFILNLDNDGVSVVRFTPLPIHPLRKTTYYPKNRRMVGLQKHSGNSWEEKIS